MKHGDKAVGAIHRACPQVGHVRLTGNCLINRRTASATEVATDGVAGILITVLVKRQITRECDISLLKRREG